MRSGLQSPREETHYNRAITAIYSVIHVYFSVPQECLVGNSLIEF